MHTTADTPNATKTGSSDHESAEDQHTAATSGQKDHVDDAERLDAREASFVRVLELVQAYLDLHSALSATLKAATFDLAAARYSMGSNRVGHAQYPAVMRATTLISPELQGDRPLAFRLAAGDGTSLAESCHTSSPPGRADSSICAPAAEQSDEKQNAEDGDLQYSTMLSDFAERFACSDIEPSEAGHEMESVRLRPPLQWFGAMPAPALRSAQTKFEAALDLAAKVATAQASLSAEYEQFAQL